MDPRGKTVKWVIMALPVRPNKGWWIYDQILNSRTGRDLE